MSTEPMFDTPRQQVDRILDGVTLSARVDRSLRERVLARAHAGETQSDCVRRLLELAVATLDKACRDLAGAGTSRRRDSSTAKAAAATTVRPGTARHLALSVIVGAGLHGQTADDVIAALEPRPLNTTARRVTDLLQAGMIEPVQWEEPKPGHARALAGGWGRRPLVSGEAEGTDRAGRRVVTRPSRRGAPAIVYVATELGVTKLREVTA